MEGLTGLKLITNNAVLREWNSNNEAADNKTIKFISFFTKDKLNFLFYEWREAKTATTQFN